MEALSSHWQDLYAVPGAGGLKESAGSVADLLSHLQEGRGPDSSQSEFSDLITVAELLRLLYVSFNWVVWLAQT